MYKDPYEMKKSSENGTYANGHNTKLTKVLSDNTPSNQELVNDIGGMTLYLELDLDNKI